MKKIIAIYILGTFLPIFLFIFEKNLPYFTLKDLTILVNDITAVGYEGIFSSTFIILIGLLILIQSIKDKNINFEVILNQRATTFISLYTFYRLISAIFLYTNYNNLDRADIQILEGASRSGYLGFIIQLLNSLYPILLTIIASSYLSLRRFKINSLRIKYQQYFLLLQITILGLSSVIFDIIRGSRGNITFFGISLIVSYLISFKAESSKLISRNKIISLVLSLLFLFIFLGNTYYRSAKVFKNNISINTDEAIADVGLLKILHDSTIAKAVGGQIITNKGITGDLYLTSSVSNQITLSKNSANLVSPRDKYCKRYDCLHLFQPIHKIMSFFGYSKEVLPIYIVFTDDFPFNSSSHLGSLYLIFKKNIAPLIYLILIYTNIQFFRSSSDYLQFASIFNMYYFSIFAFTDNWFVTLYPYISIFMMFFISYFGIKIQKSN